MTYRFIVLFTSVLFCSVSYAQLSFSSKNAIHLTAEQVEEINAIIHKEKNEKIGSLVISNAVLQKIHEYGDYGPYLDGQTTEVNKPGILIEYKIIKEQKTNRLEDTNFRHQDEACYTYFIPDDKSKVFYSYTIKFGFPPSFGGAAKVAKIRDWQRKILKVIKK